MSSNIFRATMLVAGLALLSAFFGASTVQAARPDTSVCDGLSGKDFGICTAAVSSGCATDGRNRNTGSKHCDRLERNFGDKPVWLETESESEPPGTVDSDFGDIFGGILG